MYFLKKMIIHGFKSFGIKTEIDFKDGIIGIVGPNGCGKSNVVDALKWVLGERNIHSIRGDNVKDIIFAGTEEHKPLGMAEVEIILNNADLTLPVKYNEVSVKRRVFRSGETEYFINKNSVRLKDVSDLFADTGVGKGAYSFMEQGKIDMILSNKPEDRRVIFEEAAGISRYKIRKRESLTKLESTNNNLEQINVLLRELENERTSLKSQWEKTKIYNQKKEVMKDLEIKVSGSRYRQLNQRLEQSQKKISELIDRKMQFKTENSSLNSEIEKINQQMLEFNQTKNKFEKDKLTYEQMIKAHDEKITIYQDLHKRNQNDIDLKKSQLENLAEENKKNEERINMADNDLKKYEIQKVEMEGTLSKIIEEVNRLNDKKAENIKYKEMYKTDIENNKIRIDELKIELRKVADEFIGEIDKKKKEVEGKQDTQVNLKNSITQLMLTLENHLQELRQNTQEQLIQTILEEIQTLKRLLDDLTIQQDEFKNLIFDENGSYSKKERIDREINKLMEHLIADQNHISLIETENEEITKSLTDLIQKRNELDNTKNDLKHYINNTAKEIQTIKNNMQKNHAYLNNLSSEIKNLENENNKLRSDIKKLSDEIEKFTQQCDEIDKTILKYEEDMNQQNERIMKQKGKISDLLRKLEDLENSIEKQKENKFSIEADVKETEHYLYHEFDVKIQDILSTLPEAIDEKALQQEVEQIKLEMHELGHVNLLAEELYEDVNKRYQFHVEQRADLLKAKEDLLKIIDEVNKESEKMFMDTFEQIRQNFHQIFRRIFGGGKADLILLESDNILESGIEINAQPPGKKINSYAWLSGGERTLLAIGLLFSVFLVKPSPFCVLDEIDAALDEQNNMKFLNIMKEFSKNSQFLIVSHNKQTIANCDYLYGITMEEKGISKIISLELKREKIDEFIK